MDRILNNASAVNGKFDSSKSCSEEIVGLAVAMDDPLCKPDGEITAALTKLAEVRSSLQSTLDLLDTMKAGGASTNDGVISSLCDMMRQMDADIQSFDSRVGELRISSDQLSTGISSMDVGVDSLATGTDMLLNGARSLSSGVNSLKGGVTELSDGTGNVDEQVQNQTDDTVFSITGGNLEPVSYADARNRMESVQFVICVPGVSEAEKLRLLSGRNRETGVSERSSWTCCDETEG